MVIEAVENKEIMTLDETLFWEEDDPKQVILNNAPLENLDVQQCVDISKDAYIVAFTGTRGAGKTIAMTAYAIKANYLFNTRIISNYPIDYVIRINGVNRHVVAEPLDMYKLLCFDKDYQHCLILIDESPDIISHMAAMTWKNRLLNIFVRQLRKNMNSLFLGCQQLGLIDKSMRWQTDLIVRCQDAFRLYGSKDGLERGAYTLLDIYDNSGQWTGEGYNADWDAQLAMMEPQASIDLPGRFVWGTFDTYYQQDIFESLRKVDMNLNTYEIGDGKKEESMSDYIARAMPICLELEGQKRVETSEMYDAIGEGNIMEKRFVSGCLRKSGVKTSLNGRFRDFSQFDREKFIQLMSKGK